HRRRRHAGGAPPRQAVRSPWDGRGGGAAVRADARGDDRPHRPVVAGGTVGVEGSGRRAPGQPRLERSTGDGRRTDARAHLEISPRVIGLPFRPLCAPARGAWVRNTATVTAKPPRISTAPEPGCAIPQQSPQNRPGSASAPRGWVAFTAPLPIPPYRGVRRAENR